jgi:hypothetical protein
MKTTRARKLEMNPVSRIMAILSFIVLLSVSWTTVSAQTGSVNFSGTWAFNESKSTQSEGGFRFAPALLAVNHSGTNIDIESTSNGPNGEFKSNSKYTTDGKECSNTMFGDNIRKSLVTWSADKKSLVFSHTMNFERDGQSMEMKSTETWKINESDKTLAIESVFNTPNGEMRRTNVYDKK